MRLKLALCAAMAAATLNAELVKNPDENTLWIEDGKDIAVCGDNFGAGFNKTNVKIEALPEGGFSIESGPGADTGRYMDLSPEYPWIVFEITGVELKDGYRAMMLPSFMHKNQYFIQQGGPQKGVYAANVYENSRIAPEDKREFLRMDLHGVKLKFKHIKMVREPDYSIRVASDAFKGKENTYKKGDTLKFAVKLKERAEDVSLNFFDSVMGPLQINGSDRMQLKAADETGTLWTAEAKISQVGSGATMKAGDVNIKAVILGSENAPDALWGMINAKYEGASK